MVDMPMTKAKNRRLLPRVLLRSPKHNAKLISHDDGEETTYLMNGHTNGYPDVRLTSMFLWWKACPTAIRDKNHFAESSYNKIYPGTC